MLANRLPSFVTSIFAGSLALSLAACGGGASPPPWAQTPATYAGRTACTSCHQEENKRWQGSHHDLAMDEASAETVLGDFDDATFTYAGVTSTFFQRDSTFFVRTDGPDGQLQDYEIAYTFGVIPLQQYLIAFPGGRYQTLGIAWDSRPRDDGGQRWFHLYPDDAIGHDDPLHWTGLYQNWNYMCADCHSTNLNKNYISEEDRYETSWSDLDVACEACHGPGSNHLAWAEAHERGEATGEDDQKGLTALLKDTDGGAWVMNPETGIARRRMPRQTNTLVETCAPCHSRRGTLNDAFQPGHPLMDSYRPALLDEGVYHADGQIMEEVYVYGSFIQSKMYHQGVTCADCHDPHSLDLRAPGNALCGSCHLATKYDTPGHHFHEAASPGAQCVNCHMPAQTYMVVDPRRDHSLRVPRPDLSAKLGTPNACTQCHTDETATWAAQAVEIWYGPERRQEPHYGEVLHAGRSGTPEAEPALVQLARDPAQPGIARASALTLLARYTSASALQAIQSGLRDDDPLARFAALRTLDVVEPNTRLRLAVPLLTDSIRTVRIEAARVLAPLPAHTLTATQRGLIDQGVEEYVAAERFNADRPEAHLNLGLIYAARGRFDEAEAAYRTAIRLNPASVQAHVNLSDLYRMQGRDDEGERVLRQALEAAPEAADVHHALGLLLVRRQQIPEALEALRQAATLLPENARFSYVYGVALHSTGDTDGALRVLAQTTTRHPYNRDVLMALATIHRDNGSVEAALKYTRDLAVLTPQDPAVRQLLAQLEAQQNR